MTDFLIIKDPHFRFGFEPPRGRTSDFFKHIKDKIEFLIDYGKKNDVKNLIITGDLLDHKNPSSYYFSQLKANETALGYLRMHFNMYTILGNHDLPSSSLDRINESVTEYACKNLDIHLLDGDPVIFDDVNLCGLNYRKEDVFDGLIKEFNKSLPKDKHNIFVCHQPIIPSDEKLDFGEFSGYNNYLKYSNINSWIIGHIHKGYSTRVISKKDTTTHFFHPWSMTRLARDYYAMNEEHTPEFIHLSIEGKGDLKYKSIFFPILPFKDAFRIEELKSQEKHDLDLQGFIKKIKEIKTTEDSDLVAPDEIKDMVEEYIEDAKKEIGEL